MKNFMAKNFLNCYSWKKMLIFKIKLAVYLSLGLHEGRPSYRTSLQPSKGKITSKHKIVLHFFLLLWSFSPSWIRIRIQTPKSMRIRIHNTAGRP
jgi:hypothetical protein